MIVSLPLPADVAGQIISLSVGSCSASYDAKNNAVLVDGESGSSTRCLISAQAPGGPVLLASVSFRYVGRDCGWRATDVSLNFGETPIQCNGPLMTISKLTLPADVAGKVTDVTSDSCSAGYDAETNTVIVDGSASAPTCTITVSLEGGAALSAVATFQYLGGGPCGGYYANGLQVSQFEYEEDGSPPCSR